MKIEVLKLRVMNCVTCNRDVLMAEVSVRVEGPEDVANAPVSPLVLFCSGCGGYFEIGQADEKTDR